MARHGKIINMYYMDDSVDGRVKCTVANWTGVIYKIPRDDLSRCQERSELKQSGVYFLFGASENDDQLVYVGQAGSRKNGKGILLRLQEHDNPKEYYWNNAVVITTQNNSFGPTEISYLENRFHQLAQDANRYKLVNSLQPYRGRVTEEKEVEMDEFIDLTTLIIGALGYRVFMPLVPKKNRSGKAPSDILHFAPNRYNATAVRTSEGFVLLKGSQISPTISKACSPAINKNREKFASKVSPDWVTTEDIPFGSSSAAAGFVGGCNLSGNQVWVDDNGVKLGELLMK